VQRDLVLSFNRLVGVDVRAVADLFPGQPHLGPAIALADALDRHDREQDAPARQPRPTLDGQVPDDPVRIVEVYVLNPPERSVHRIDRATQQLANSPLHR
jgi:hypothetical protein